LRKINAECISAINKQEITENLNHHLSVLKNEIAKICFGLQIHNPLLNNNMDPENFSSGLSDSIGNFLNNAEKLYIVQYNTASKQRDDKYDRMVNDLGGRDAFLKFKQQYYNKRVADIVTNANEIKEFSIQGGEMLRLKDAVFRTPESMKGRAHFYAPTKRVLNLTIGTFWFNLMFVWLFSGVLFVILYFDILRKIIAYFETLLLSRRNRIRLLRLLKVYEQPSDKKSKNR
jgi:ABC transport system ATP-binding/permease protein